MDMPFLSGLEASRRREIMSAVAKVLIDEGKRAVEMQEVLEQSGMLFDDVVSEFSDLDDVFLSLVRSISNWIGDAVASKVDHPNSYDDMLENLSEFGRRYVQANSTIFPGVFRIFLTEGSRRSRLQEDFYAAGPAAIADSLTAFLDRVKANSIASFPASSLVAEALMGILREPLYRELAIHSKDLSPVLASIDRVPDIVRMFVEGCAREAGR